MPRWYRRPSRFASLERDAPSVSLPPKPQLPNVAGRSLTVREFLETADRYPQGRVAGGPKGVSITPALLDVQRRLSSFREEDFGDPAKRNAYRALRARQLALEGEREARQNKPAGGDRRHFNPTGKDFSASIYGSVARLNPSGSIGAGVRSAWLPVFVNPTKAVPCIQRKVRREVMFAKKFAGVGYHSKKRRGPASSDPC